jgi:hypothetical protein
MPQKQDAQQMCRRSELVRVLLTDGQAQPASQSAPAMRRCPSVLGGAAPGYCTPKPVQSRDARRSHRRRPARGSEAAAPAA